MISPVFWMNDRQFAFQYVGGYFRLYGADGEFIREFRRFEPMIIYIEKHSR